MDRFVGATTVPSGIKEHGISVGTVTCIFSVLMSGVGSSHADATMGWYENMAAARARPVAKSLAPLIFLIVLLPSQHLPSYGTCSGGRAESEGERR